MGVSAYTGSEWGAGGTVSREARAQSSVIGVVLILGLVVAGTAGVLLLGSGALSDV